MDIALCSINYNTMELDFAGAYNPLIIIRNEQIIEIKGDNISVGSYSENPDAHYTNHKVKLEKGDVLYVFSDGYADQFGGPDGKKFKTSYLKKTLQRMSDVHISQQRNMLEKVIEDWRAGLMQVDDMLVIGVKV